MIAAKAILNLVPLAHSTAILSENVKLAKKKDKKVGDFVGTGIKTIIGTEFIKMEADLIGGFK